MHMELEGIHVRIEQEEGQDRCLRAVQGTVQLRGTALRRRNGRCQGPEAEPGYTCSQGAGRGGGRRAWREQT